MMEAVGSFLWRAFAILGILWASVGMVTVVVLIRYTMWREQSRKVWTVTECPACEGTGVTPEQEICGLCDGESALHTLVEVEGK